MYSLLSIIVNQVYNWFHLSMQSRIWQVKAGKSESVLYKYWKITHYFFRPVKVDSFLLSLYHLCSCILQTGSPTIETFLELLDKHPDVFYPTRTAKSLHTHWLLMKQYHLLPDQSIQPMPRGDHVLNFSDAEDLLTDEDLKVHNTVFLLVSKVLVYTNLFQFDCETSIFLLL